MTHKVLIVDDSKLARMAVMKALNALHPDWARQEASSAGEALECINQGTIDIVLLDFNMPGKDGLMLAAELRQAHPDISVAVISANHQVEVVKRAQAAGAAFLPKPLTVKALGDFLDSVAKQKPGSRLMTGATPVVLSELELDALTELVNLGVSNAALSLRELVHEEVILTVPRVSLFTRDEAIAKLHEREPKRLVAVHQDFDGDISGRAFLIFPEAQSMELVRAVVGGDLSLEDIMELEQEALAETGNILLNACLGTIANNLERNLSISLPEVVHGEGTEFFNLAPQRYVGDNVLFIYINFAVRQRAIQGYIAMLLDFPTLATLKDLLVAFIERNTGETVAPLMALDQSNCAKSVLDAINGGLIVLDASECVIVWNAWMEAACGPCAASALGKRLADVFPEVNLKRLTSATSAALMSGASTIITHALNPSLLPLRTKSNRDLLHNITVSPVGSRPVAACLIFITDVTMAVGRERYLRDQQNARYDAVVARAPDVIITIDDKGVIQSANPAASVQFDYSQSELVGKEAATLFETKEEWAATWRPAIESARYSHPKELIARRKDSTLTYLEASASSWTGGARVFVTIILRDTNERRATEAALRVREEEARNAAAALKYLNQTLEERVQDRTAQLMKTEEALRHSQKMEAIGNLTGGVAHDFNNLLQVISGNLALLKHDVLGNQAADQRVRKAMDAVSRSAKLSSQLLAFARRQALEPKVINLGRFIRDMEDILRKAVGEGVVVETIIAAGLWNTLIDPGNVENALLNLAINARDAMEGQGHLTIEAGNTILDSDYAQAHDEVVPGQYVLIAVCDTGSGMASEVVEKAFEPFYTTKPEGKGTGLGLSMVYGFVKQSGGHIKIYSEVGQGTTIRLYLPRSTQSEDRLVDIDSIPVTGGSEVVLVAEDDESVRETVVALLSDLGYRVLRAKDAHSALNIIESGMPIDVLLTDVIMPGPLRSTELARKARERIPNLAVLFTSGYTENAMVHFGRLDENVQLLSKPYTREALARKLRHVLANAADNRATPAAAFEHDFPVAGSASPRALRILVCEHDELIREPTVEMLRGVGYLVTPASDARAALAILVSEPVDILLTHIGLPDMSGVLLAEYAQSRSPALKVIFTTARTEDPSVAAHLAARTLIKPFSFDALLAMIASVERADRR